ncbi:MAG: (d)CMP kinase [Spirochaetales bacterium]|nr:(d)CMP kinase [Spirochaetales bacterium]
MQIAIDGPAGAGKSSIAKIVAQKLGLEYIDSGAIYRALAKKMLDSNIKIEDYASIKNAMENISIELINGDVFINGVNFTPFIRSSEVTAVVSPFSAQTEVRRKVNFFLNSYSENKSVIMDGRDIGSVVFPNADYKFYLDASVEERARRRLAEIQYSASLDEIKESISKRDYNDEHREVGALKRVEDAIYIDTTEMSMEEVVDKILFNIKK